VAGKPTGSGRRDVIGLSIVSVLGFASCGFMVYVAVALWRDLHPTRTGPRARITLLATRVRNNNAGKVIVMPSPEASPVSESNRLATSLRKTYGESAEK
jgi:hypothetical protein